MNARMWLYLAAAFGQKYNWIRIHEPDKETLPDIEKSARAAVASALEQDPELRHLILLSADPNGNDRDLESFWNSDWFKTITNRPPSDDDTKNAP